MICTKLFRSHKNNESYTKDIKSSEAHTTKSRTVTDELEQAQAQKQIVALLPENHDVCSSVSSTPATCSHTGSCVKHNHELAFRPLKVKENHQQTCTLQ